VSTAGLRLQPPCRIVLLRTSALGDVVHALPVYHALRELWPQAALGWVIQKEFASLVEGLPGLERVLHFDRGGGLRAWRSLARELAAFRPELAVDAQGNLKSAAATWLSRAPRRVGLARVDWRERPGALALTERAAPASGPHAMDRMQALIGQLGARGPLRQDPALSRDELACGSRLAERHLSARDAVLLSLSLPGDRRSWPQESWHELARTLLAGGRPLCLLAGPAEEASAQAILAELPDSPGLSAWLGRKHLREFAAFLGAAAERGARLVSCDSGPMHLAASVGLPVLALEGPCAAERTGPWPDPGRATSPHQILRAPETLPCAPCLARSCHLPEGNRCMRDISSEAVLAVLGAGR